MTHIHQFFKLFLIIILLTSVCYGADERTKAYPPSALMGFLGLDNKSSPTALQDGRASDLQNVKLDLTYGLTKRHGYSLVNDILDTKYDGIVAITGGYNTKLSNGNIYTLVTYGSRVNYNNSGIWTDITGTSIITYAQNNQFIFTTANDTIIFSNDTDPPKKWTGSGNIANLSFTGLSSALTKAKCVAWFHNYLIWGDTYEGTTDYPTRIRWSNIGTIETYADADYLDISALSGQGIQAFGILYDNLYVFMDNSIYKISFVGGDDIFVSSKVIEGVGCIAKNSVQTITLKNNQQGLVFLDKNKRMFFFNGITLQEISSLISGTMNTLNGSRLQYAVSADTGESYYLCVSGSGQVINETLLEFEYEIGEWTKHTDIDANALWRVVDSNNNIYTYFGNYDCFVYKLDDASKESDIVGTSGTLEATNVYASNTTSGQTIIYDAEASFTTSGQTVKITDGIGAGQEKVVIAYTETGLIVDSAFSTEPDSTSTYSTGIIDALYQTKWYDIGEAARRKHFVELYTWTEEESGTDITVSYAVDFGSIITTETFNLTGSGGVWGTAVWGTDIWGGEEAILKRIPLKASGRYLKLKFRENEVDESFKIYGFNILYEPADLF